GEYLQSVQFVDSRGIQNILRNFGADAHAICRLRIRQAYWLLSPVGIKHRLPPCRECRILFLRADECYTPQGKILLLRGRERRQRKIFFDYPLTPPPLLVGGCCVKRQVDL